MQIAWPSKRQNGVEFATFDLAPGNAQPKALPGATGAVDWSAVAYMLTALYMVLQIVLLVPKYRQMLRDWKGKL